MATSSTVAAAAWDTRLRLHTHISIRIQIRILSICFAATVCEDKW